MKGSVLPSKVWSTISSKVSRASDNEHALLTTQTHKSCTLPFIALYDPARGTRPLLESVFDFRSLSLSQAPFRWPAGCIARCTLDSRTHTRTHSPARPLFSPRPAEVAGLVTHTHTPAPKHRRHNLFAHDMVAASDETMALIVISFHFVFSFSFAR